jgi:ketosteroid isomerase-like protein
MVETRLNVGLRRTISILVWAFAVYAQASCAQDAVHDIEDVERRWNSAIASGDQSMYDELLTDDFSWTFVSGRVINRQQMIETIGPVEIKERDKTIREYENTAVVTGIASLTVGGRPLTERFIRVWIKGTDGSWQLTYFQATEIE